MDGATLLYLVAVVTLGSIFALSSLLGDEAKKITTRVVCAYLLAGGAVSLGIVTLLIDKFGFSWYLLAAGAFSGYKAFDIMALVSFLLQGTVKRFFGGPKDDSTGKK